LAHHTLNARTDAVAERIREAIAGRGADLAIEISGAYPALHDALRSVAVGGRVVASGFYQGDGIDLRLGDEFHHNRVQLICSQIGGVPQRLSGRWSVERLQQTFLRHQAVPTLPHMCPIPTEAGLRVTRHKPAVPNRPNRSRMFVRKTRGARQGLRNL
jgi:NADPH:quinone reductase-like Zn-dependent oxidoreductase